MPRPLAKGQRVCSPAVSLPPSDLRPLALGEIVDRAATFWRQHFRPLLLLSMGFNLLTYILSKVLQLTLQGSPLLQVSQGGGGDLAELGAAIFRLLLTMGGVLLGSLWLYYLNTLVVARDVAPSRSCPCEVVCSWAWARCWWRGRMGPRSGSRVWPCSPSGPSSWASACWPRCCGTCCASPCSGR